VPIEIIDQGTGNFVHVARDLIDHGQGRILIRGNDNRITIAQPLDCASLTLETGGACEVKIWPECILGHAFFYLAGHGRLEIGAGTGFNGNIHIYLHERGEVRIGRQCLFGGDVEVTVSDMHSIVDLATGRRVNPPADVMVEDRVWVGAKAALLKGARIGTGSIIGTRAVVTGPVPPNCVAAGVPARVVRRGVTWSPELLP
jgi:acetyltransferase-like isoleucine patch superfamily enzyme